MSPETWDPADRLAADGYHGRRVPSFRCHPGINMVLWAWNEKGAPKLRAFDPNQDVPLDPSS